ncbi:CHAT domain-containing tetratricopeptide repeat protein [Ekhidna sp.]|uniref:CHAT domain-containing tetratricopeptide repeat protein n=1 Tax=Ekhidna sp. TaxID=2608089 RepID=UPI00329A1A26
MNFLAKIPVFLIAFILYHKNFAQQPDEDWYNKADSLYKAGNTTAALKELETAASFFEAKDTASFVRAKVKQGQILVTLKDSQKALSIFDEIENLAKSGDVKIYINLLTQKGFALANLRKTTDAKQTLESARDLIETDSLNHYALSYIDAQLLSFALQSGRTDLAKLHLENTIFHAEKSENDEAMRNSINKAAMFHWRMGNSSESLNFLQKEELIVAEKFGSGSPQMANLLRNMAIVASSGYELEKAIFLVHRALNLLERDRDTRTYFLSHSSLSNYHNQLGEYQKALAYSDTALAVAREYEMDDVFLIETIVYKMTSLRNLNAFDELRSVVDQLLDIQQSNDLPILKEANIYRSVSRAFLKMKVYELSEKYVQQAIELVEDAYGAKTRYLNDLLVELADIKKKQGKYEEALVVLNKVFINVSGDSSINPENFSSIKLAENYAAALRQKADVLYQKSEQVNLELLTQTMETLKSASDFINTKRKNISGESFGSSIREGIKEQAIECLYSLYSLTQEKKYLKMALGYSEMARSDQLRVWLMEAEKFGDVGLEQISYEDRKSIKEDIAMYEQLLNRTGRSDSSRLVQLNDTLRILRNRYDEINLSIKEQNAKFYSTIYDDPFLELDSKYNLLSNSAETTIIFNKSLDNWYIIMLGEKSDFIKIDGPTPDLEDFRSALTNPNDDSYEQKAKALYRFFLEPVLSNVSGKKLNFLTDKGLSFIPLELLINQNDKYLLEENEIRYSYSLNSQVVPQSSVSFNLLAIAPDFSANPDMIDPIRNKLSSIPGADKEVNEISSLFSSTTLIGAEASEINFKKRAKDYGIVHLATHAIIDDNNPQNSRLVFQNSSEESPEADGFLHAYEIYNLNLKAQLVTLSACNTGFGKIERGEGVMSLSRAFAYAGVPATVVSLWPASDKSTPELMKYFYQNLKDGQTKDVALNNARKQYLATAKGKARHPFYWGGFVLIGDNSPIEEDTNLLVFVIPSVLIIVMILTVYRRKKKSS